MSKKRRLSRRRNNTRATSNDPAQASTAAGAPTIPAAPVRSEMSADETNEVIVSMATGSDLVPLAQISGTGSDDTPV